MSANTNSYTLSPDLFDHIIDHLHNDHPTLLSCSLVCKEWLPSSRYHLFQSIHLYCKSTDRTLAHFRNFIDVWPIVSVCVRKLRVQASRKMRIYSYRKNRTTTGQDDAHDGTAEEITGNIEDDEEIAGNIEDEGDLEDENEDTDAADEGDRGQVTSFTIQQATIDLRDLSAVTSRLPRLYAVYIHGVSWPGGLRTIDAASGGETQPVAARSVQKLVALEVKDDPDMTDFLDIFQLFPHVKDLLVNSVSWQSDPQKAQRANIPPDLRIETVSLYRCVPPSPILEHTGEDFFSAVEELRIDISVDFDPPLWSSVINRASSSLIRLDIGVELCSMDWSSINILPCKKLEDLVLTKLQSWHEDGNYGKQSQIILSRMPPTLKRITFALTDPELVQAELELWDWSSLTGVLSSFTDLKAVRFVCEGGFLEGVWYTIQDLGEDVKPIIQRGLLELLTTGILLFT